MKFKIQNKIFILLSCFLVIIFLFSFKFISSFSQNNSVIDLRLNWTSKICPIHNQELKTAKVEVGNLGPYGTGCSDCKSYGQFGNDSPPYMTGENPNAKYRMSQFTGCVIRYKKAKIYYCKICESGRLEKNK